MPSSAVPSKRSGLGHLSLSLFPFVLNPGNCLDFCMSEELQQPAGPGTHVGTIICHIPSFARDMTRVQMWKLRLKAYSALWQLSQSVELGNSWQQDLQF